MSDPTPTSPAIRYHYTCCVCGYTYDAWPDDTVEDEMTTWLTLCGICATHLDRPTVKEAAEADMGHGPTLPPHLDSGARRRGPASDREGRLS